MAAAIQVPAATSPSQPICGMPRPVSERAISPVTKSPTASTPSWM